MKDKDYSAYAPDKHGPEAEARKAESAAFIESLRKKHGLTEAQLYPVNPDRNRHQSHIYKEES